MLETGGGVPSAITPHTRVRATYDPSKRGVTTGQTRGRSDAIYVEIRFDSGEIDWEDSRHLEPVPERETRRMAFERLRFSGAKALRDALLAEKVRGELTDVHYAMGSGNAEFLPHQFKPVMRFVRSALGRMLIADEVGLGKTIEAIYIWRELQARTDARRLLVVCPAGLRRKWQEELASRFSIQADIKNASELLELVRRVERDPACSFAAIVGLEAIRAKLPEEGSQPIDVREELMELLDRHKASVESAIFDLTIIDEAHHLRNSATASHQAGQVVIEASSHAVLLSATPLQTSSDNLYRLLHLLDPDRFSTPDAFMALQEANAPLTQAVNALQAYPPRAAAFREAMNRLLRSPFFRNDLEIGDLAHREDVLVEPAARVDALRLLEARSLYGDVMTRTRKRDVTINKVLRTSRVIRVKLSSEEHRFYQSLTRQLREAAAVGDIGSVFAVIARERQLSSSIPAALARWGDAEALDGVLEEAVLQTIEAKADPAKLGLGLDVHAQDFERIDSKFAALLTFLREALAADPTEKFVVFTFFRGTIAYLGRRLAEAGIEAASIWGGMGDAKSEEIARFRQGASVLLSTEVGSEGIDLQFARFVINYDLPWNPMRVEQRIGRIDRIGQSAEKINIVSFVIQGTIDETIIDRLYARIGIFTQSVGDLEEILGDGIEKLTLDYFRNSLSEAELAARLDANAMAAEQNRAQIADIEEDIAELAGHASFLHKSIKQDRDAGRWVRPEDLSDFLTSFLHRHYPGSSLRRDLSDNDRLFASFNTEARGDLHRFIQDTRPARTTRLHVPGAAAVPLIFDARQSRAGGARPELVDLTHPVIHWARAATASQDDQSECVVALTLSAASAGLGPGVYVFAVDFWRMDGVRKDVRLVTAVRDVAADAWLDRETSDRLIDQAARDGVRADLGDDEEVYGELLQVFAKCEDELHERYLSKRTQFRQDNKRMGERDARLITERADRRMRDLRARLDSQRRSHDLKRQRAAPMTEGLMRREEQARDQRLLVVSQQSTPQTTMRPVAGGVIVVV
jgi:superfamily II DNA or RNA helicase